MRDIQILKDSEVKLDVTTAELSIDGISKPLREWKASYLRLVKLYTNEDSIPDDVLKLGKYISKIELSLTKAIAKSLMRG